MRVVSALLVGSAVLMSWLAVSGTHRVQTDEEPDTRPAPPLPPSPEARLYPAIGSVTDADRHHDGWYVLDADRRLVHVVAGDAATLRFEIGGSDPASAGRSQVLLVHFDTVAVFERRGGVVHLHSPEGHYLRRRRLAVPGCSTPRIFEAVSTHAGIVVLALCRGNRLNTRAFAVLEGPDTVGRVLASWAARPRPDAAIDPYFAPVLAGFGGRIVLGNGGDDCLTRSDLTGLPLDSLCPKGLPHLPLPEQAQTDLARARTAARALGARLADRTHLPRFDRIYGVGPDRYAYRAPSLDSPRGRRLMVTGADGSIATTLPTSNRAFAAPGEALLAWLHPSGVHLARYPLH